MKAINNAASPRAAEIRLDGGDAKGTAKVTTLSSVDLNAENSFEHPTAVAPEYSTLNVHSEVIPVELAPYSLTVYRIRVQ